VIGPKLSVPEIPATCRYLRMRGSIRHFPGFLIGAEGHVDDHACFGSVACNGRSMRDHHIERDADGCLHAIDHHAERVANEKQIAVRIEEARHRRGVGGQAHDRVFALHRLDAQGCKAFLTHGSAHGSILSATPSRG